MSRTHFHLLLSLVCALILWGVMILAGVIASLLPGEWRLLPGVLPVVVIVFIGVAAAQHWWTWGSSLTALPLLAFGVYSLVEALRSPDGTRYHSYAVGFAIAGLGYGLALAVVAMSLAGLGVIVGKRLHDRDQDDAVMVRGGAALQEGTPADSALPLQFGRIRPPKGPTVTHGPDGHQAAHPAHQRP